MKLEGEAARRYLEETSARHKREREEVLSRAKAEAAKVGKEPFDLDRLDELWVSAMRHAEDIENEDAIGRAMRQESYEYHYYVLTPEIRTMADFARHWQKNEMWLT